MSTQQSSGATAETEIVKKVYDAINRNDIPAALELFDPQIVRIEPEGFPMAGTYHGLAAMKEHLSKARATWAEGTCEAERLVAVGEKVIAYVHVRVRLKTGTDMIDGRLGDVFTFRNGKVVEMRTFDEVKQALEWVGVSE